MVAQNQIFKNLNFKECFEIFLKISGERLRHYRHGNEIADWPECAFQTSGRPENIWTPVAGAEPMCPRSLISKDIKDIIIQTSISLRKKLSKANFLQMSTWNYSWTSLTGRWFDTISLISLPKQVWPLKRFHENQFQFLISLKTTTYNRPTLTQNISQNLNFKIYIYIHYKFLQIFYKIC